MTGISLYDPKIILTQAMDVGRHKASILAQNLTSQNIPGYVRKESYETQWMLGNNPIGPKVFDKEIVNEALVNQIRVQHSIVGEKLARSEIFQKIQNLFGPVGSEMTFAHKGKIMSDGLDALSKDSNNALDALSKLKDFVISVSNLSNRIQDIRSQIDLKLEDMVKNANQLLQKIASCNQTIVNNKQAENLDAQIDARRQAVHELSEMMDIFVVQENDQSLSLYSKTGGELLVGRNQSASLGYIASTAVTPFSVLSPLSIDGFGRNIDISASILGVHGSFRALMDLRDNLLPDFQSQVDQYAVNLRDSMNAIHNQGSALSPPNALVGTIGVPLAGSGAGTSNPLTNSTVISGNGTLRIGNIGANGTLIDFSDLPLNANSTVGTLINTINNANIGITATITPLGQLSLTANVATNGVALAGGSMCFGPSFTGTTYGVSHFFGLNNLFTTGTNSLGSPPLGASNQLQLRTDIASGSGSLLARGLLTSDQVPNANVPIGGMDGTVARDLATSYSGQSVIFPATQTLSARTTNLDQYAKEIIAAQSTMDARNKESLQGERFIYDSLSSQASDISSVNPSKIMQDFSTLLVSQNLNTLAYNIMHEMDNLIFEL